MIKQQTATEPKGHTSQPDLINFIKDHLAVNFDTLQDQVTTNKKEQAISQSKHPHFQPSKHLPSSSSTTAHPGDVHCLLSDGNTIYGSLSTSSQKYMTDAAKLGPEERINRINKDSGLYTIVIPSTSPHPTLLERKYEGMMNSSWIHILFQQYFSYGKEICV
jgi:hypothetical protein